MGRIITPDSEEAKEMEKWEYGPGTKNGPYRHQEFPKMLYRARKRPDGKVSVAETDDAVFNGQPGAAELWSAGCQKTVRSEDEYLKAKGQGWCDDQKSALESFEKAERSLAEAAAHRHFEDQRLSEKAKEEAKAADDAAFEHVAEVKEKPKRRGRPKKTEE